MPHRREPEERDKEAGKTITGGVVTRVVGGNTRATPIITAFENRVLSPAMNKRLLEIARVHGRRHEEIMRLEILRGATFASANRTALRTA